MLFLFLYGEKAKKLIGGFLVSVKPSLQISDSSYYGNVELPSCDQFHDFIILSE